MPTDESVFTAGTSFFITAEAPKRHLWFVLSDPAIDDEFVVYVNLTSFDGSRHTSLAWNDPACVLDCGDYPQFITHRTCVCYGDAKVASITSLDSRRQCKPPKLSIYGTVPVGMLAKARDGATRSMHMPQECLDILERQQLI